MNVYNIEQLLENNIKNFLNPLKDKFNSKQFDFSISGGYIDDECYQTEFTGYHKSEYNPNEKTPFVLLRYMVLHNYKQVQITNIFLPDFMKHMGIGKSLINEMFVIVVQNNYKLFIVDMVLSFYERMIARGALPCDEDSVEIVQQTKLL